MSGEAFKIDPSLTSAFNSLESRLPSVLDNTAAQSKPNVVVLGGGTGASLSIRTLLSLDVHVSAVVSMADDGGSTGIIRKEAHVTPPGDVRKCLCAMAADQNDPFTHAFRYRFEFARNHTLGNLMLSALEHETGSFPEAIRICGELLNTRGDVYPSTLDNVMLSAIDVNGKMLVGQALASHSENPLRRVWLVAPEGCHPYDEALRAIREADAIVLGPGSLFTSIIPNLLVPGVLEAIHASKAVTLFVCSLADIQGETWGLSAEEHVDALLRHGMRGLLDHALIHTPIPLKPGDTATQEFVTSVEEQRLSGKNGSIRRVSITYESAHRIHEMGVNVIARNLADPARPTWHDPQALRNAFTGVLKQCLSHSM